MRRSTLVAIARLVMLALLAPAPASRDAVAADAAAVARPNVLLVVLDDATVQGANAMLADTKARVVGSVGVAYQQSFVAIPSCCPERGTLLTGQLPHNHGVTMQSRGGTLDKTTTLPADLRRAGYRTYHVGKLLHEDVSVNPPAGVFHRWLLAPSLAEYQDPTLNLDGRVATFPGYSTRVLGAHGRTFLQSAETADDAAPWYLSLNFKAPHLPSTPEPRYAALSVPRLTFPDEADRSDKPPYIRNQDIDAAESAPLRRDMWRTLATVDDEVVATLDWLAAHGELANTLVVLTSDNGYHHGQNRRTSKFVPYTPSLRVPLWVRGPGVAPGGSNGTRMVSGVDVAATVYDAAGITPSRRVDGDSLLDPSTRTEVYAEYFNDPNSGRLIPPCATVRSARWQYIETYDIAGGALTFREWYDLGSDPHMLVNLLADGNPANDPDTTAVARRLAAYRTCAGSACP